MGINFFHACKSPRKKIVTLAKKRREMERNRKADRSSGATNLNWVQTTLPRVTCPLSEFVKTELPVLSTELKETMLVIGHTKR